MIPNKKNKYFTLNYYEYLLKSFPKILRVRDYPNHDNGIILRHDVDLSIDLAYEFSRIEKRNSIVSTYYILMTSDLYNPFSNESKKIIKNMLEEGFEIGLHFDPTEYGDVSDSILEKHFVNEVEIFKSFFDCKVYSYSLHNPSIHGKYPNFTNYISVYGSGIFSDDCYISDSVFSFRGKDLPKFCEKSKHQLIQFVTHPAQYFSNGKVSYEKQINYIINKYYKKMDSIFQVNKVYSEQRSKYKIEIKKTNK